MINFLEVASTNLKNGKLSPLSNNVKFSGVIRE